MAESGDIKIKILVTGANGQLGNEFRDLAASFPQFEFLFVSREELPIDDLARTKDFFASRQFQYCINCAAYTAVDNAEKPEEKEKVKLINADAVRMLASLCKKNNTRLVHISTDYVFNGKGERPYREDDPVEPVNAYGASKLLGEQLGFAENPGMVLVRSSWIYSSHGKNFVKTMLRLMGERKEINVVNDQFGCPTYAADLAAAIMKIISAPAWTEGIYHFSNKGIISWFDFAVAIRDLSGSNCQINSIPTSAYSTPAKRPAYSAFDTTKIQESFGIKVKDWKESLRECLEKMKSLQ